ncbi:MAG: 50S ribosomal protein L23 [Dehalococcoidia bacterium]|jgi:large subunit ribosomal protein L23
MHPYQVVKRPLITEKATIMKERNKYAFEVMKEANKRQIKEAVEVAFKVNVVKVTVMTVPGKMRRIGKRQALTPTWKKAVVTLTPGEKIEFFEGV